MAKKAYASFLDDAIWIYVLDKKELAFEDRDDVRGTLDRAMVREEGGEDE